MKSNQWIMLLVIFLFVIVPDSYLSASGWHDYELDIGEGYKVFRSNSLDISIGNENKRIIFPRDYPHVGPVTGYQMLENHVLSRNSGKSRNLLKGNTFEEEDYSVEWFFIIPKETNQALGPFDESTFQTKLKELGISQKDWIQPKNPNILLPIMGISVMLSPIVLLLLLILCWHYWDLRKNNNRPNDLIYRFFFREPASLDKS